MSAPANPYAAAPLFVATANPATGKHIRAIVFLGSAPKAVIAAARRRVPGRADPRVPEWTATDAAVLRAHYGASWRALLTPRDPPEDELRLRSLAAPMSLFGGDRENDAKSGGEIEAGFDIRVVGGRPDSPVFGLSASAKIGDSILDHVVAGGAAVDDHQQSGAAVDDHQQSGAAVDDQPGEPPKPRTATLDDFGDLGILDAIADAAPGDEASAGLSPGAAAASADADENDVLRVPGPPEYSDIAVYPEDTIYELRLKVQAAGGAPFYRQHFFYYINDEGPNYPFRISIDGVPAPSDWRALAPSAAARNAAGRDAVEVAGLVANPTFEERRAGLRVEALDTFTLLSAVPGVRTTMAFYVDFDAVLDRGALAAVVQDRYQFDLIYYGALLRYWPHLSPDAAGVAISTIERQMRTAYPDLAPSREKLCSRFAAERIAAEQALAWRSKAEAVAVTAATARVPPTAARMKVAVRNVFDWIRTDPTRAAAKVRIDVDATAAGAGANAGGIVPLVATKRHASSFTPKIAPAIDGFVARPPRRDTVAYAIARGTRTPGAAPKFATLVIHGDGRAEVSADWRDDDRVGFEAVAAELAETSAPTLAAINEMDAAAFPIGGHIAVRSEKVSALGAITVSAFYPGSVTAAAFRDLKAAFRALERGRIVAVRGLQSSGAFAFAFRKGVVAYPEISADVCGANQYAWMSDEGAAAKWAAVFAGRAVRMYHRATDLRVEVVGADSMSEFATIRRYIFAFLAAESATQKRAAPAVVPSAADPHRLRRLQERDPALFDLKKYDPNAVVYSVLCQSGRQPVVFDETEAAAAPAKRRAGLTKYWNFTEAAPAYYECPDREFSHLSFRSGIHPLGYCLPCCKKTTPSPSSRAAAANAGCLASAGKSAAGKSAPSEGAPSEDDMLSRHVLAHGKAIPVGRVSRPPSEVSAGLFLDAFPPPYGIYLVGVDQEVPAVPEAGFAFSLAHVAAPDGESPAAVLTTLADIARFAAGTHHALGGGAGGAFETADELADAILGAFVRKSPELSPFGPGGRAADTWPAILADLARHAYGIEIVTLAIRNGSATVEAATDAAAAITGAARRPRLAIIAEGPGGVYPATMLNPKLYLRSPMDVRWQVSRRTFGAEMDAAVADRAAETIRQVLAHGTAGAGPALDLATLTRYAASSSAFAVETRLIDYHNMCYGVYLVRRKSGRVYIPVARSPYPVDGTAATFGPRPVVPLLAADLAAAVADINQYLVKAKEPCAQIVAAASLVDADGKVIGFATASRLYFYHDASAEKAPAPIVKFPYDSREIDRAIAGVLATGSPAPPPADPAAIQAAAKNRIYKLFVAEFAAALRGDRNEQMRGELAAALSETSFDAPASVAKLRRRLAELLRAYPADLAAVREAVGRAYVTYSRDPKSAALATIGATMFEFDRKTLAALRALPSAAATSAAVRKIMAPRVEPGKIGEIPNVTVACAAARTPQSQCAAGRLKVPADRIDEFYDLLAADVRAPGSDATILSAGGVADTLEFVRYPGEMISVVVGGVSILS